METYVEFRSDLFPAYEGEENEVNPGRWGKRLAEFLRDHLRQQGFQTGEPSAEDWGWMLPVTNESFPLWIGCGNFEQTSDGFLCFIEPHTPFVRRFLRRISTEARVGSLQRAVDKVLDDASGIRDKRWWTYEEFNRATPGDPGLSGESYS